MSRSWLVLATSLCAACPSPAPDPRSPAPIEDASLRIRIARAEARRAGGIVELAELAAHGTAHERRLALRGLGRIGATGPTTQLLIGALGDPDPEVVGAAAGALGIAASLDDGDLGATDALISALPRGGAPVIEALGRAGTVAAQPVLVRALDDPRLAELAGLALGRHGRRKLALAEASRQALVAAAGSRDPAVRYAAVYALAREHQPPADAGVVTALVRRLGDPVPEIRAQAIAGIGRRKALDAARAAGAQAGAQIDGLLLDRDWRVAVEAVRTLGAGDDGKDAIAAAIVRRYGELERGEPTAAHVVIEAEQALAGAAQRPVVGDALALLATSAASHGPVPSTRDAASAALPALTRGWIECLAIAARVRAAPEPALTSVEQCALTDHLRLPLVAELIAAKIGSPAVRRAALARLLSHAEPRVRAAALGALAAQWTGDDSDRREAGQALTLALAATDPSVASAAVDAATAIYDAIGTGDHGWLDRAVIARATAERDPELAAAVLELIGARSIAAGADVCRAHLGGDPVRARAAATCLQALHEPVPTMAPITPTPPPVDVSTVIGKRVRWRVTTSRGEVVIRLSPDNAPWAVATIAALSRRGFYDGLEFHRVVGNFVVQGGDPTESGSGGPGFSIPAEPSMLGDGPGYVTGGVGIADAGRDSGGSQWFVMHSRAPHLDGRYTWIGAVESGQNAVDALVIGDRVLRTTIEIVP
jgi:peptidyl-prolyl cis-trans isomerase B (cyclophilin B)